MNRKRWPILCAIALFAVAILVYANFQKKHTFALANDEGMIKSEQIQPLFGTVKVSGDCDTDVVFTDMETGEKYVVGYITSGVSEKIKLEKGKWYTVAGRGNLVISPVKQRFTRGYKRYKETSGLIEWKKYQIFHSIFT